LLVAETIFHPQVDRVPINVRYRGAREALHDYVTPEPSRAAALVALPDVADL
jgi:hypothetical protein